MYELQVSGHYPVINETNIDRNLTIKIFLSDEIDTTSINYNNIVVVDYLYQPVKGFVGYDFTNKGTTDAKANILTFTPDTYLDPDTVYSVYVNKFPESIKSVNDKYLQTTYKFSFTTGIGIIDNPDPTVEEQLRMDLANAIDRQDWCDASRIQAILDGTTDTCGIPSGIPPVDLPQYLLLTDHTPKSMESNIPFNKLKFIKLEFNDIMPASGIDYNSYINIMTKNVLE